MSKYKLELPRKNTPIPSLDSGIGNASKKELKLYTGNKMVGISIIHKSCLQPIFSKQEAEDVANMRR